MAAGEQWAIPELLAGTAKPFRGSGPTGKSYELIAMEWFQLRDGKIYRRRGARDTASQARQMGLT